MDKRTGEQLENNGPLTDENLQLFLIKSLLNYKYYLIFLQHRCDLIHHLIYSSAVAQQLIPQFHLVTHDTHR